MHISLKRNLFISLLVILLLNSSIQYSFVSAAGAADCPLPATYDAIAQGLIDQNDIPTSISTGKGTLKLNGNYLSNQCGLGKNAVVYGTPANVPGNQFDQGQWRYLGYDLNGVVYRNWKFRSDSRATKHVAKNWVKTPWEEPVGNRKGIIGTPEITGHPEARAWLEKMIDPYHESATFIQSYNNRTGKAWTGDSLKPYVIFQQVPTKFSPGVVQMWNIWQPDGSWWYEMFEIPALDPLILKQQPDLLIKTLVSPADAWVGDSVPIKITTENKGTESSGPFTVGIVGTNFKSEVISNVPPGQVKTVTVNVSSTTSGIKSFTAKTDFGEAVVESNETNNTKPFKIAFNKKNEPTTPIAIISHLEGDHRTEPEITIKPAVDPKLDDKLSYSPGKEAITLYEWKYKAPNGTIFKKKPITKDFATLGEYLVELRVTNSKNKVSEWAQLKVTVTNTTSTPKPSPTPTPSTGPEVTPTPTPKRPIKVDITFDPIAIFTGEQSKLVNNTINWVSYTWSFSSNLAPLIPDATDFEHSPITFNEPGIYSATLTATDEHGFSETKTTYLSVNDPKPTAIISGVTRWIQGRPFPSLHHLDNSYTPLASRGTTIDWSRSEKRYKKKDGSAYTSSWPTTAPMELGSYELEGKVYDSFGRMSEWAIHPLEIVPDEPPTVEITAPDEGVRNNEVMLYIDASSPDGDDITSLKIEERYDSNGEGNFEDETWNVIYDGSNKFTHTVKYTSVGKRQYRAVAKENFGLSAASNLDETNIINMAPVTNFNVFGTIQQPDQGEDSGPPITNYTPESILRSWTLKKPYVGGNEGKAGWKVSGSSLTTRNAVWADFNGNYNLAKNLKRLPAWEGKVENIYAGYKTRITVKSGYYYEYSWGGVSNENWKFQIRDARTGAVEGDYTHHGSTFGDSSILDINTGDINTAYFRMHSNGNVNGGGLRLYNIVTGQLLQDYPNITPIPLEWGSGNQDYFIQDVVFTEDKNYAYVTSLFSNGQSSYDIRKALYVTKYALHQKTALWTVLLDQRDNYATQFVSQPMAIDKKGNLHVTYYYHGMFQNVNERTGIYKVFNPDGVNIKGTGLYMGVYSGVTTSLDKTMAYAATTRFVSGNYGQSRDIGVMTYNADSNTFGHIEHQSTTIADIKYEPFMLNLPAVNKDGYVHLYNGMIATPWGSLVKNHPLSAFRNHQALLVPHNTQPDYSSSAPSYYYSTGFYTYDADLTAMDRIVAQPSGDFYTVGGGTKWKYKYTPATSGTVAMVRQESYQQYVAAFAPNQIDIHLDNTEQTQWIESSSVGGRTLLKGTEFINSTKVTPDGSLFLNTQYYDTIGYYGESKYRDMVIPLVGESTGDLPRLLDDNTVEVDSETWGGLLYDPASVMRNQVLEFNVAVNSMNNNKAIGAAIRIQDEKNLYAIEWTQDTLFLYRVVNGQKTELARSYLARPVGIPTAFKIEAIGSEIRVIANNVKLIEVSDGTYATGSAGLLSLGQQMAAFSLVKRTNYGNSYPQNTYDSVLVNDPISYEKLFQDIEGDAMGAEEWSYSHKPNFFENPESLSVHNGKTYPTTINALEKAGLYEITFRGQDDPGLASYRKWSQPVKKIIYVHRRPIAQPDVRFTGRVFAEGEALDYETFDKSYDPDIAHVLSDKLFRTRWADETKWTTGKREYYNRPGVELIIQEQVRDIHGAWSFWAETVVYKDGIPPVNQTKPVMTITYPTGTTAAAPTVLIKEPTITWSYFDAEGDPQESYRLSMTYVDNNETALYIEHEGNALSYKMLTETITPGRVVKVQGQVYSAGVWSNVSNVRYFVLDLPPTTYLLSYNGPDGDNPIYTNSNRPQLRTFVVDPENHPISAIDYEVFRASSGATELDTNAATAAANYTTTALAEGLHYWRARANDSYIWGPYSSNGFFFVDTVKPADVNEQLDIEPTAVTVSFNAFSDADPSSGHATRTFFLQKVNADGSVTNIDLNKDGSAEYSVPLALTKQSYRVEGLISGQEYRVTVLDYDVAGNEGHYAYIHFVTNRPPTGDFDWSPKPVYEGDMVQFKTDVEDEDGNILVVTYKLTSPSGVKKNYSYNMNKPYPVNGPSIRMSEVGNWIAKMVVSDEIAEPITVTKVIQVRPLGITGWVSHTTKWEENRLEFNKANPTATRPSDMFWAGEEFVLSANVTDTGSSLVKADKVTVGLVGQGITVDLSNSPFGSIIFKGSMWRKNFDSLPDGNNNFLFTTYYSNGVEKTTTVKIQIKDSIWDITKTHLTH
nr:hypothetical protein [Paenibacillus sp. PL91]